LLYGHPHTDRYPLLRWWGGGGGGPGLAGHERKVSGVKVFHQQQIRLNSKSVFFLFQ
jgi:hypothetical protein